MSIRSKFLTLLATLLTVGTPAQDLPPGMVPLPQGIASADHLRERPLKDALDKGFCGIEASVWLSGDKLLVAEAPTIAAPDATLESIYLEPLMARVKANEGRVFRDGPTFTLIVNARSEAEATYTALKKSLEAYTPILTTFSAEGTSTNAVTVILTGNRPRAIMEKEVERVVAYDGRINDLSTMVSPDFMPVVSDDWNTWFRWRGEGEIGDEDKARLKQIVALAQHHKLRLRLTGAPSDEELWKLWFTENIDLYDGTDLDGLGVFLGNVEKYKQAMIRTRNTPFPSLPTTR